MMSYRTRPLLRRPPLDCPPTDSGYRRYVGISTCKRNTSVNSAAPGSGDSAPHSDPSVLEPLATVDLKCINQNDFDKVSRVDIIIIINSVFFSWTVCAGQHFSLCGSCRFGA